MVAHLLMNAIRETTYHNIQLHGTVERKEEEEEKKCWTKEGEEDHSRGWNCRVKWRGGDKGEGNRGTNEVRLFCDKRVAPKCQSNVHTGAFRATPPDLVRRADIEQLRDAAVRRVKSRGIRSTDRSHCVHTLYQWNSDKRHRLVSSENLIKILGEVA